MRCYARSAGWFLFNQLFHRKHISLGNETSNAEMVVDIQLDAEPARDSFARPLKHSVCRDSDHPRGCGDVEIAYAIHVIGAVFIAAHLVVGVFKPLRHRRRMVKALETVKTIRPRSYWWT